MTEYNIYDMKNMKEFLGQDISNQFHFSDDFIKNLAEEFIEKIEKNNIDR